MTRVGVRDLLGSARVEDVGAHGEGTLPRTRRSGWARDRRCSSEFNGPPCSRRLSCHRGRSQDSQTVQMRRDGHRPCADSVRSGTLGRAPERRLVGLDTFASSGDMQPTLRGMAHNKAECAPSATAAWSAPPARLHLRLCRRRMTIRLERAVPGFPFKVATDRGLSLAELGGPSTRPPEMRGG